MALFCIFGVMALSKWASHVQLLSLSATVDNVTSLLLLFDFGTSRLNISESHVFHLQGVFVYSSPTVTPQQREVLNKADQLERR